MEIFILVIALAFAVNIGASGTAAAMSESYGSGALRKPLALVLAAIFVLAGAVLAGGEVAETISHGIVEERVITLELVLVALLAAVIPLFLANILGIPLSTSEVSVGALIGVGLAVGGLQSSTIGIIVLSWLLLPFLAFGVAGVLQRSFATPLERALEGGHRPALQKIMALAIIGAGCNAAFAAGANNTANAVGPLIAAGILSGTSGLMLGGVFLGLGAVVLGGRVLETNGRRITLLSLPSGVSVSLTASTLVLVMSLLGIPVPLTQATTGAIVGVGFARNGRQGVQVNVIKRVVSMWVLSPAISLVLAFFLMNFLQGLRGDYSTLLIVILVTGGLTLFALLLRGRRAVGQVMEMPRFVRNVMGVNEN